MHSSEGEMATAIIYLRVSTSKQVEAGNGLDAQKAACLAFAEREGLQVTGVFVDAGVSGGAELQSRPGMMDAINALQKGGILLVAKRDRIARDVLNNAVIEKMVSKKKSSIASADGAGNGDDAAAALMRNILAAMAAYEKALAGMRTKAALKALKSSGRVYGPVPYGFQRSGNELISNDNELQVVQDVTSWREVKATWAQCVERLNTDQRYTRSGRPWSVQNLSQVIRRAAA
jgi:DNA invertase Pin-like site-specific DNA recombinase